MGNLTRFDPYGEMRAFRRAMHHVLDEPYVRSMGWRMFNGEVLAPAVDIHQTDDDIVVTAALPGAKPEDIEITITGQTVVISGEFKADERIERDQYLYRERRHGTFSRQLQLPVHVQGDRAAATFNQGVLELRIPKAEEVKPRQVAIRVSTGAPEAPAEA